MLKRGLVKEKEIVTIFKSETFPTTGFGYASNLKPELAKKIVSAFATFRWENEDGSPSSLKSEFSKSKYARFIPISYKKDWAIIRSIDRANNISYNCETAY